MERIEGEVYCEYHGCIHDHTDDPYEMGYKELNEEPECDASEWRKLWVGGYVTTEEK